MELSGGADLKMLAQHLHQCHHLGVAAPAARNSLQVLSKLQQQTAGVGSEQGATDALLLAGLNSANMLLLSMDFM